MLCQLFGPVSFLSTSLGTLGKLVLRVCLGQHLAAVPFEAIHCGKELRARRTAAAAAAAAASADGGDGTSSHCSLQVRGVNYSGLSDSNQPAHKTPDRNLLKNGIVEITL